MLLVSNDDKEREEKAKQQLIELESIRSEIETLIEKHNELAVVTDATIRLGVAYSEFNGKVKHDQTVQQAFDESLDQYGEKPYISLYTPEADGWFPSDVNC